jgi:hypothetical protein
MAYVLEEITNEIADQIMKDAECDPAKKRLLERREYFYVFNTGLSRAIDKEKNYYIFVAPHLEAKSENRDYFFFCDNKLFRIRLVADNGWWFYFADDDSADQSVIDEIKSAFGIHQYFGKENESNLNISYRSK